MYFGCPVFATPYGSLPELVSEDVGFLSANESELVTAVKNAGQYSAQRCHEYARDLFNADVMANAYVEKYQQVVNGNQLNPVLGDVLKDYKRLPYNK